MAEHLVHVNFTVDGVRGLIKDGCTGRHAAAKAAIDSLGGKLAVDQAVKKTANHRATGR